MRNLFKKNKRGSVSPSQGGFTLVEIMVAMSIFAMVMLVAIGGLVVSSNSAKKARSLRTAMDNVNYAMENMSRSLRLGSGYSCVDSGTNISLSDLTSAQPSDCSGTTGGSGIIFTPANPDPVNPPNITAFQWNAGKIKKISVQNPTAVDLTSDEVTIKDLKFFVKGTKDSTAGDLTQPRVYIIMKGVVTINGEDTEFALQTLASQRNAE